MGKLGRAVLAKVESGGSGQDWSGLAPVGAAMLDERHVLIYSQTNKLQKILERRGWAGAMHPGYCYYLMVVDSNVGLNKVNANIAVAIAYSVDLSDPRRPIGDVFVRHVHRAEAAQECRHVADYGSGEYEAMMARCYWDYLRVYVRRVPNCSAVG